MAATEERIPKPIDLGTIDPSLLDELQAVVPDGAHIEHEYSVSSLLETSLPSQPSRRLFEVVQPLIAAAVDHYDGTHATEADTITLLITNRPIGPSSPSWRRVVVLPTESFYFASGHNTIEFAHGERIPLIDLVPNMLLNGVTNALIGAGRLTTFRPQRNRLYTFGASNLSRSPKPEKRENKASIEIGVYNSAGAIRAQEQLRLAEVS